MPIAPANVKDLIATIVRSRLMTADELRPVISPLKPTGRDAEDLENVRRTLVAGKHLTEYQVALVMRGLTEGFFLGPYKVLELIAKGRMAGVYKAEHTSGQVVAIKVLPASKARDPEILARFKREGRLLTRLDHPNVVRAFHVGEADGKHYLVLEYLDGDTLDEVLERCKRLPALEAVRIVHQALLGLQHIHERGMIHRDLNPSNLMLVNPAGLGTTVGSTVKILDIGLGKAVFTEGEKSPVDDPSQLTTDGVLIGTPDYLAPEQARSAKTADIRSDIYSLGCVLYHAVTGQPPFPDKSVLNQVMRHATEQPRPLSDFLSDVPDGLQNVMNWMMAKDPGRRYATPERAAQALNLFLRNTPPGTPSAPLVPAYSRWLETSPEADTGKPTAAPLNIPVGRLETPGRKAEAARTPEVRKPSPAPVPPLPAAPPVPVAAMPVPGMVLASFDVELVPVDLPKPSRRSAGEPRGLLELNRRDAIMLIAGAVLVILAVMAGWGLSKLLGRTPPPETQQNAPAAPGPASPPEG